MINLFEFKLIGSSKSYTFKLLDTMKNVIEWVKIIEGMIKKINKKMNDLKILTINQGLNVALGSKSIKNNKNKHLLKKNSNEVEKKELSFSSSLIFNNNNDVDKGLFQISESQEDG